MIKIQSHITLNLNGQQKIKDDEHKLEEIPEKNRKNSILKNYKINNNSIINLIILFEIIILINIFFITENKIFNLFFLQTSKIILKLKGIGENKIFGNYFNDEQPANICCILVADDVEKFVKFIDVNDVHP